MQSVRDPTILVLGLGAASLRIEEGRPGAAAEYNRIFGQLLRVGREEAARLRAKNAACVKPGKGSKLGDAPTPTQLRMLRFVDLWIEHHGYAPTTREIATGCGVRSTNAVIEIVLRLEKKGFLMREPNLARSLRMTEIGRAHARGGAQTSADAAIEKELSAVPLSPEEERAILDSWGLGEEGEPR